MAKEFVPAEAFCIAVIRKVVMTDKGGNDLMQITLEIPRDEWVVPNEVTPLRGQVAMVRMESIRLEETKGTNLRLGRGVNRIEQ